MTGIKKLANNFQRWQYSAILVLFLLISALHFSTILQPAEQVFDEQYYVPAAQSILQGDGTDRTEHPPLGQLFIAAGIRLFGHNAFGWRIFPLLFGLAGIWLFYLLCLRLGLSRQYAFLAGFLLAFENLSFIQSSVAMLDAFCLTFMLAAFWLYLKGSLPASGLLISLAALTKLTGLLALPVILLHWLLTGRKEWKGMITLAVIAAAVFFLLMPVFDFIIWHKWLSPFSQTSALLQISSASTFAKYPSEMLSRPWDWIIRPEILTYWIDPHYLAMISPTLWVLIIPGLFFALYQAIKRSSAAIFALSWFAFAYLVWLPASLIGDRISYIYYFYPAVGAICLALALAARSLENLTQRPRYTKWKRVTDWIIPLYLLLSLGAFVILSPVSYWWKAPLCAAAYLFSRYYVSISGPAGAKD